MRPIDADEFKKYIIDGYNNCKDNVIPGLEVFFKNTTVGFLKDIDEQPTVFNPERVVEQLEECIVLAYDSCGKAFECIPRDIVLEIMDGGGIDGN